jgi:translation elongation factor EF-1beta
MPDLKIDRVVELKLKIRTKTKEIEEAREELFKIENVEKLSIIKQHLNEWFWNNSSYVKPLMVEKENVLVLSAGQYEGNPFIEFEVINLQNLDLGKRLDKELPKDVETAIDTILKTLKNSTSWKTK